MSREIAAKRYALALFHIAKDNKAIDQLEHELLVVKEVFSSNKELLTVLNHPKVSINSKKTILKDAFASLSQNVVNTLLLLVDRHRINTVSDIADNFVKYANEERGTEDAVVYSVKPLKESELSALSSAFAKKIGKSTLRLQNVVDKDLIGGINIRIGNRIYDGSVSGKLERLERQLVANRS
ncbi:F0F1 ATP synthase subunit delta [Metabacillus fastidiosus]|uniref:F0F1 ATP synthase subunit delta n=1 Tax=Metabacillus fastidiosus TaxID=1458 RepID=UPI002DBE4F82|nr:F0F1 ATP synthase subunit delta [Metabacillus fastidiosus]MEC2076018.1 F0F1 ATP synthase subunit delta [Metabacillus fastidiosus]MED4534486.1 F0F1 ATP synthase subunit delta [Metabacillus fastidiosus]